jgi:glycerophosphoryl diester phosphodiesterase
VIAHRGCPRDTAENSLDGIRRAAALGADAVEIDVRLTRDGTAVLMHDRLLRRTTGSWWPTAACSSGRRDQLRLTNDESIPTFADALAALPLGLRMAIEVKAPRAIGTVLDEVHEQRRQRDVMVWSKHSAVLRVVARRAPEIETTLLRDTFTSRGAGALLRDARVCGAWGISARWEVVTSGFAGRVRELGLLLYSWCRASPVVSPKLGLLDGLVTDYPTEARAAIVAAGVG